MNMLSEKMKDYMFKKKTFLCTLMFVGIYRLIFYFSLITYAEFGDSQGYISYSFIDLMINGITSGRTPIYPLTIDICSWINEKYMLICLVFIQCVVSFISIVFFYKTIKIFYKKDTFAGIVTILYGCNSSVIGYDKAILTESFALSGTVIFIYMMLSYLRSSKIKYVNGIIIILAVLTFLRPSFLLFDVIVFGFFIMEFLWRKDKNKKIIKRFWCIMLKWLMLWLIILMYSLSFYKKFGIFTISDPIPRQNLIICMERGYYNKSNDNEFINKIDEALNNNEDMWKAMYEVYNQYSIAEVNEKTKDCIKKNFIIYLQDTFENVIAYGNDSFTGYYVWEDTNLNSAYIIRFLDKCFNLFKVSHVYLIFFVDLIVFIYLILKKENIWLIVGFMAFIGGITVTSYFGTCGEYPRTMVCVIPFSYLNVGWLLSGLYFDNHNSDNCETRSQS